MVVGAAGCEVCEVAGCDAGVVDDDDGSAVCCATALSVISREAVTIDFQVRITLVLSFFLSQVLKPSSISQLKNHMYDSGGIYGRTISQSGFEANLAGGHRGGFIQAVAHATHDSIYV